MYKKVGKIINNMLYIFSVEQEKERNLFNIQKFKEAVPENVTVITEKRFTELIVETLRGKAENIHCLSKEIYYELLCISHIGIAILELVPQRFTFFENFQKIVDEKIIELPEELKEIPKVFDEKFPFEPLFRILSREMMKHIDIIKFGLRNSGNKLEEWCNNMNLILCKLIEKCCGRLIIKMLEEEKGKELQGKNRKHIIAQVDNEIRVLEHSIEATKETRYELQEYFYTNMKLLNLYVYIISILKIFKLYKSNQTFLILVDEFDYAMFISIFSNELKQAKKLTSVKIFGNITMTENCKLLDKLFKYTIATAEEHSMMIANELLQEEQEKQKRIEEKNKIKEEKRRLIQENLVKERQRQEQESLKQENLEKERLKQENLAKERLKQENLAKERLEKERLEKERLKQENLAKEHLEKERLEKERQRQEQEHLEKERLKQENLAKEHLKQENLAKERLKQENLAKEQYIKTVEQERISQILAEEVHVKIKKSLKFNPSTEEFIPSSIKMQQPTMVVPYQQIQEEMKIFKSFPCYLFRNQSILGYYFDNYPSMFKYTEVQAYYMVKNHLSQLWNNLIYCYDYRYRDTIYQQFKNLEASIIYTLNS
jgi:hypothetical protein